MRREQFQEVKIVENEKGQFQEVKIVENEKGQVSRSLSPKDGVGDRMQKKEKRILIGRIVYASSIASIYV